MLRCQIPTSSQFLLHWPNVKSEREEADTLLAVRATRARSDHGEREAIREYREITDQEEEVMCTTSSPGAGYTSTIQVSGQ